jgi:hypothetical protein
VILAEGETVSKITPPLSDQTGVAFFHQKQKGKPFDVSDLFSVPSWQTQRDGVLCLLRYRWSKHWRFEAVGLLVPVN